MMQRTLNKQDGRLTVGLDLRTGRAAIACWMRQVRTSTALLAQTYLTVAT
jgi:phosphoribosylformimino-5-aminoimidazole carboxamide ribonucleotide (ProFAR) isomerase